MGFEDLEPIFGEARVEYPSGVSCSPGPYLFHLFAADASHLQFIATDFRGHSLGAVRSVHQLEDMRDYVGVGGSWAEFMDYVISSFKSDDVKLLLAGDSESNGTASAKLVCQKSKGMPLISVSLTKLVDFAVGEAMANLSLQLLRALRDVKCSLIKEQERCHQLTQLIAAEQEKSETIKDQVDVVVYSKKHKVHKTSSDKAKMCSVASCGTSSATGLPKNKDEQHITEVLSVGVTNRVVPTHHRSKIRGVVLHDTLDE